MTSNTNKPLKWTTQRIQMNHTKASYRIQKKSTEAAKKKTQIKKVVTKNVTRIEEIEKLEKELEFTYDSIATITVHFESLQHAYATSKPELDRNKSATRLCEMEKELLTAYDDLGLQVSHLERKINKIQTKISQLKAEDEEVFISSPCSTTDSSSIYSQPLVDWSISNILDFNEPCQPEFNQDLLFYYDLFNQPAYF